MRRIKRLLSFAIAGALLLGVALTDGFIGDDAFRPGRAFAEASDDGSDGEETPSGEKEPEAAESQEKKEEKKEKKEKKEEPEQKEEKKEEKKEETEQKQTEEKAPEAPEQKAEEKAPEETPGQKQAEEVTSDKEPDQKAEAEKTSEDTPEQKEEEKTSEDTPEQKEEEKTSEDTPGQKEEEKSSEEAPEQKEEAQKPESKDAGHDGDEEVRLTLAIASPDGLSTSGGAWQVDPAQVSTLTLAWSCEGECDAFEVSVSGGVYSGSTHDTALKLSVGALSAGKYTATVKAIRGGKAVAKAKLSFRILASGEPADGGMDPVVQTDPGTAAEVTDPEATDPEATDPEATDPEAPDPEAGSLSLVIAAPQGLPVADGVYQVDPAQVDALTFAWEFGGDCDGYAVTVSGDVYGGETADTALTLPLSQLAAGKYTVTVEALKDGSAVARAELTFQIADTQQPGDQPEDGAPEGCKPKGDMPTGGMPKGGAPKGGGAQGAMTEEEQGFHVTPGEALVSTHTSGDRDMTLYNAVALTLAEDAEMTALVLGGVPLDVTLEGGSVPFTGHIESDTLTLTAAAGDTWTLNGRALKILSDSGIDVLMLVAGSNRVELCTALAFQGGVFASLCGEGFVSADYTCRVNAGGMAVEVAGDVYRVGDTGELIPMEGDGNAETMVYPAADAA